MPARWLCAVTICVFGTLAWAQDATVTGNAANLIQQGKTTEAIELLQTLPANSPGAESLLGKAYFTSKQYQQAVTHLQLALQQTPQDWESMQLLALSYYGLGQCGSTIPLLEQVSPHLPAGQADAPYILGSCYARTQQLDKARQAFAAMFGTQPDSAMAHFMLAKMLVRLNLEDQAGPEIEKALTIDTRLPMAHFLRGEILLYQQNAPRALEEFQKELAINPSVWLVYWRLGDSYMRLHRYDEAEKALKQALWLNESFSGSYLMLGEIELQRGDPELARGFLERAIKVDPQNYYAHYALGRAYQKLGRTTEANREFALQHTLRTEKHTAEEDTMEQMTH
jgi:tetratricopeptide (TPR) repeat protein